MPGSGAARGCCRLQTEVMESWEEGVRAGCGIESKGGWLEAWEQYENGKRQKRG